MLLISGISVSFSEDENIAVAEAQKKLGLRSGQCTDAFVYKRSLDARRRDDIRYVYTVALKTPDERRFLRQHKEQVRLYQPAKLSLNPGKESLSHPPVVAGFGPAGMFAALLLARAGYRPVVLERGGPVEERVQAVEGFFLGGPLDVENNVQFGEGGAGTFSDGKLTTRIGDPLCEWVLERLVEFGAPAAIKKSQKPHIGTDRLREILPRIRAEIEALGGKVYFHQRLAGLHQKNGRLVGIDTTAGGLATNTLILALGHSARDSFRMLLDAGVHMEAKSFSVGLRIEHLQTEIDRGLYGKYAGHPRLPVGEYQLSLRQGELAGYTFCMCPGGSVVAAASEEGGVVVNGMSMEARSGVNANSALCCSVTPQDYGTGVLDGVLFQERLEKKAFALGGGRFLAPCQTVGGFLSGTIPDFTTVSPSYPRGVTPGDLSELLPPVAGEMLMRSLRAFGHRLPGFCDPAAVLTGIESRTSSPVRIVRDQALEGSVGGLYPAGEGAGYAGGIMSAAVDGLRVATAVIERFAPSL